MAPISFYEKISDLRIMSFVACIGVLMLTAIVAGMSFNAIIRGESAINNSGVDGQSEIQWWKLDSTIFIAVPIILFGYICQSQ